MSYFFCFHDNLEINIFKSIHFFHCLTFHPNEATNLYNLLKNSNGTYILFCEYLNYRITLEYHDLLHSTHQILYSEEIDYMFLINGVLGLLSKQKIHSQ